MNRLKQTALNATVIGFSVIVALALCEFGARLFLNSADYLSVTTVKDDILGMTIAPHSAGFDAWGFRNPGVPRQADVVAVGDSHTFGNTARMEEAWPSVVAQRTGLSVYNLGMGGYGPNQYYQLLTTRGLSLHPKWVICGLYFGDDFENAFSISYGLPYWTRLRRQGNWGSVDSNIWDIPTTVSRQKQVRNWLARKSMVYRLLVNGPLLAGLKERMQFGRASGGGDPLVTTLEVPEKHIQEAFRPTGIANRLNQSSPAVAEGMRITFGLLAEMNAACHEHGCTLVVAIIPTKESVFADEFSAHPPSHLADAIDAVVNGERAARSKVFAFLDAQQIPYVDTLGTLREHAGEGLYAQTTEDMHPGKNGYRLIGEAISAYLVSRGSGK